MAKGKKDQHFGAALDTFAIDLRRLFQKALEHCGVLLGLILIFAAYGGYKAYQIIPIYSAIATLELATDDKESVEAVMRGGRPTIMRFGTREMNTIAQSVMHYDFLREVAERRRLHEDPVFTGGIDNKMTVDEAAGRLKGMVIAHPRRDTMFLDVTGSHRQPNVAQLVANAVATEYVEYRIRQRGEGAKEVNKFLLNEANALKARIKAADLEIQKYKRENDTVSFEDRQSNVLDEVAGFNQQLLEAKTGRLQLEADLAEIKKLGDDAEKIANLPSVQSDPVFSDIKKRVIDQEAAVAALARVFKPKYPKLIQAKRELEDLKETLAEVVLEASGRIEGAFKNAQVRENSIREALTAVEKRALDLQDLAIEYNSLVRDKKTDEAIYDSVLLRIKEAGLSADYDKDEVRLVETAGLPRAPSGGNKTIRFLVTTLFGVMVAFALVIIIYFADNSLKTVDEAESYLDVPVLGAVPREKGRLSERSRRVSFDSPQSKCAEAFRSLRTSIQLLGPESERRIVAFTSADPGEGKSFTCSNYAISEAQQGKKTLLVDLDLRRPTVGRSWEIPSDTPGVTSYLLEKGDVKSLVQKSPIESLDILPAGPQVPNPAEQLSGPRVERLLQDLTKEYDRIVLDTAPINAVSDTLSILPHAHVTAVVIRAGKTPRKGIQRCIEMIERAKVKIDGSVLNFLPLRSGVGYYYYYRSADHYTSKGVYGAESRES